MVEGFRRMYDVADQKHPLPTPCGRPAHLGVLDRALHALRVRDQVALHAGDVRRQLQRCGARAGGLVQHRRHVRLLRRQARRRVVGGRQQALRDGGRLRAPRLVLVRVAQHVHVRRVRRVHGKRRVVQRPAAHVQRRARVARVAAAAVDLQVAVGKVQRQPALRHLVQRAAAACNGKEGGLWAGVEACHTARGVRMTPSGALRVHPTVATCGVPPAPRHHAPCAIAT